MHRPRTLSLLVVAVAAAACGDPVQSISSTVRPSATSGPPPSASAALPPPYDLGGVLAALNQRMSVANLPTAAERANAGIPQGAFERAVHATVEHAYPGDDADVVSINLLVIDIHDPHITVDHRLAYVVETTGHATGNCFTMFDASTAEQFLASCFHGDRTHP
jgi:hypothetical protein